MQKGSRILLLSKKFFYRSKEENIWRVLYQGKDRVKRLNQSYRSITRESKNSVAMEYYWSYRDYSKQSLALYFGRGSLYKNPCNKTRKNTKSSFVSCSLHFKGKNRQKERVWETYSNWKNWREFLNSSFNRSKNGRQTISCSHGGQPCTNLWTRMSTRNRNRQGLLFSLKHCHHWNQHGWFTKAGLCQKQATRECGPTFKGPPRGNRALDWSSKILRFKKIQNEIRQGNSCLSVYLYYGLQYPSNIETPNGKIQSCLKKYRKKIKQFYYKYKNKIKLSKIGCSIELYNFATPTNYYGGLHESFNQ